MRALYRPLLALAALALLGLSLSACALYKDGSFSLAQPAGIGAVRLHLNLCTEHEGVPSDEPEACAPSEQEGQGQQLLAFAVPSGSAAPATVTAAPTAAGGPTITFSKSPEVGVLLAGLKAEEGKPAWPPAGTEVVGYLSNVVVEHEGDDFEWTIDADFGLPVPADGSPFSGAYAAGVASGWRSVTDEHPASEPVKCGDFKTEEFDAYDYSCEIADQGTLGVSDLKLASPGPTSAYLGAKARVPFTFNFASSAAAPPVFTLTASTTLKGTSAAPSEPHFTPSGIDPATHKAAPVTRKAVIAVPPNAKPGTYLVTLLAASPGGGSATATASLVVSRPKIKLGKLTLNKSKGTATLAVSVPAAGTVRVGGKGLTPFKRKVTGPKKVKLTLKAKGKGKKTLLEAGKLKAKAKVTFKPSSGAAVSATKTVTLKLAG